MAGLLLCFVLGCHKNKDAEGPAESAGKGVDHAAEKTGEALKKAAKKTGEAVGKAANATGKALKKVGEKLDGEDEPASAPSAKPSTQSP
jgi:DNA anti-recombination protein RmuC